MKLTVSEQGQLAQCEAIIERGLQSFIEVGNALATIRDQRLYRATHATFEDYCQDRWGLTRRHINHTIAAAQVVENLGNLGTMVPKPANERQARPLTKLPPEQQREAWEEAVATAPDGRVTAAHVERTVKRLTYEDIDDGWGDGGEQVGYIQIVEDDPEPMETITTAASTNGITSVHFSSNSDEWETPHDLFANLDQEFGFTLDVCARPGNAKCERFFVPEQDGLAQDWSGEVCWMNPPYSQVREWIAKAHEIGQAGGKVVCLVPARTDTGWWWDYCIDGEIRFLRGRLRFVGAENGAPFPSAVVIFGVDPLICWWDWQKGLWK